MNTRAPLCHAVAISIPTASFMLLELIYDWPNKDENYWISIAGNAMDSWLADLGGTFGSLLALLLIPGLILAIGWPKLFAVTRTPLSLIRAFVLTVIFFGIPVAECYLRASMSSWHFPSEK
jgi:hypothetical protein